MAQLFIDKDFFFEFGKLEKPVQDKVREVFGKFTAATHTGLHLEKVNNAQDPRMRTIRIDQFWRGVVLAPQTGDAYLLLKVLPHDDAYQWAARHRATVNTAIGVVEIRNATAIDEQPITVPADTAPLFADVSDADLTRLGVDAQVLAFARTLTTADQLESARTMLPEAQYDVLYALAAGYTPEQVWQEMPPPPQTGIDPEDVVTAMARSPQRAVLVTGPDELMEVFAYPFALWRIYLHPTQRRVAYGSFSGPARVMGGPGTGKTVVALHRAHHLAQRTRADKAILLTTFTKTLAGSLEDGLRILVEDDEIRRRIDVRHIDQVAYQIVSREHGRLPVLRDTDETARWRQIIYDQRLDLTEAFLAAEWRQVILAQGITSLLDYQAARRAGRGARLGSLQRERVWDAVTAFTDRLTADGVWTYETICLEAARMLESADVKPYKHVIVDEAQDLSPWQWRLLRAAVAPGSDDLFIAGDTHQRIYSNRVTLRQVGVDIAGRAYRLKLNYRTTAEILAWSIGLLRDEPVDDLDGNLDDLTGCRSDVHGPWPTTKGCPTRQAELGQLLTQVRAWLDRGVEPDQIGVAMRSNMPVDETVQALRQAGIPAMSLAKQSSFDDKVAVGTMHRMKGLEFRCVAVVGVSDHAVPSASAVTPADVDPVAHRLDVQRERSVLFVACTRAREELLVSWHGNPSPFLSAHSVQ
jgi:superfamily I DNA/RNA helicase